MKHDPIIISLGLWPAVTCSCGKFAFTTTTKIGDSVDGKRKLLLDAHAEHVNETHADTQTNRASRAAIAGE